MSQLFTRVKEIPTVDVVRAFFSSVQLRQDGSERQKALCPFHAEDTPSFTVFENGWKCFGCGAHGSNIDLLLKASLASSPLEAAKMIAERFGIETGKEKKPGRQQVPTLPDYAAYVKLLQDFLAKTFHLEETPEGIAIPYRDENGKVVSVQIRHRVAKGKGKDARFSWREGKPYVYGAWATARWRKKEIRRVLLCEGASDIQVCWFNQIPALGIPGASAFKPEWVSLLLPFPELAIIQEPGPAGEGFVKSICAALKQASYQGQVKAVMLSEKDPRDLWLKHGERFKEELESAISGAPVIDLYPPIPLTADLIHRVADLIQRHVFFKDERLPLLIATWVLGTYVYDIFTFFGYLWINSPVKRCGKSLLEDILSQLCCQATPRFSNVSEASIFRLADLGNTLILDELENVRGEDKEKYQAVMTVLNAGFQAGGKVPRVERVKDAGFEVVYFNAYCPKVLAGINRLVDTIEDRSFKVSMVRKTKAEKVERFNLRKQADSLKRMREELTLWAEAKRKDIEALYDSLEEIPEMAALDDRFKDISEPLVAIASYADAEAANGEGRILPDLVRLLLDLGGKRGESERQEAIGAFAGLAEEILDGQETVFILSAELLEKVKRVDELGWIGSAMALGNFLRKFDLSPRRDLKGQKRGYLLTREWLNDVKSRYFSLPLGFKPSEVLETAPNGPETDFFKASERRASDT